MMSRVAVLIDVLHHGIGVPVVHRDIKDNNIFLKEIDTALDWILVLGDFGLARSSPKMSALEITPSMIFSAPGRYRIE